MTRNIKKLPAVRHAGFSLVFGMENDLRDIRSLASNLAYLSETFNDDEPMGMTINYIAHALKGHAMSAEEKRVGALKEMRR